MEKVKNLLRTNSSFSICLGLVFIIAAAIVSSFDQLKLAEDLTIYAYFALLIGVLAQILELRFGVDPMVWVFAKIEKIGGKVFGFYVKVGLLVLVGVGFWLRDILGAPGVLIDGIFGKFLVWYNQSSPWHFIWWQDLMRLQKLGVLGFYWLVVFVLMIGLIWVFGVVKGIGKRRPWINLSLPLFYPKGFLLEIALLLVLGYLAFFYFPPKTYLINEFVSLKILGRASALNQVKVLQLWKFLSVLLITGTGFLLFWFKKGQKSILGPKWFNLQIKTFFLAYAGFTLIAITVSFSGYQLLENLRKSLVFYPVSPLFFEIEKELPKTLNAKVAWFPPNNKTGESFSNAYLSTKQSFGIADPQKKAFEYLWWQVFYGKEIDYSDLLKQERIRYLIYQKNLGPTSLEQDLILAGLESKKYLTLFKETPDYLIYEFPDWEEGVSEPLVHELDEEKEFSLLFKRPPNSPIIGGVNPDLMSKKTQGFEETIEVFPGRLKEGEWWAVGSQKFEVEKISKYLVGIDWKNQGVEGLHVYLQIYGEKEGKGDELLEQHQILGTEKLGNNFDWQRQWASFETPKGAKEVNFTFYFRPSPESSSWSIQNLQVMSAQEFANVSP